MFLPPFFTPCFTLALPPVLAWLLQKYFSPFRRARLFWLTIGVWFLSLLPACSLVVEAVIVAAMEGQERPALATTAFTLASFPGSQKPLKISWYDPDLGGINCMDPCDQMATGTKVEEWRYGRTAACVPEWTRARAVIVIPGLGRFDCLDTGGAIKEHGDFIWIDLLAHRPPVPFGTLAHQYSVVVDGRNLED
jgi:hypothetical protein